MAEKSGSESGSAQDIAAENRRKLEENLARMKAKAQPGGKEDSQPAQERQETGAAPKPPPMRAGWGAWKKMHANTLHDVRHADADQLAKEADYRILELKPGASKEEVKRSFNRLAKRFHPDHGGDAEIFQAMLAAYGRIVKGKA